MTFGINYIYSSCTEMFPLSLSANCKDDTTLQNHKMNYFKTKNCKMVTYKD